MDSQRARVADRRDGIVMKISGSAEQESAVSPRGARGDVGGVDADDAPAELEQLADRR